MDNRRRFPRRTQPLEGTYRGQSGASPCRIMDISWGGCFIETVTTPTRDEATTVVVPIGDAVVEISGRVLYVERGMGFALRFNPLTAHSIDVLKELLGDPPPSVAAAAEAPMAQSIGKI